MRPSSVPVVAQELSRRALLRGGLATAAGALSAVAISACSSSPSSSTPTTSAPPASSGSRSPGAGSTLVETGPEGGRPVLLLHSWWGRGPAALEWAALLGSAGFRVVVPDLFGGRTASTVAEARQLVASIGQETAYDVAASAAGTVSSRGVPWAVVGFSLGGLFAARLAGLGAAGPHQLHLFYGGGAPAGPVSATRRAWLHMVPDDPYFTADERSTTEQSLAGAGVVTSAYVYPRAQHWFAERGTPGFDAAAFGRARARVLADLGTLA